MGEEIDLTKADFVCSECGKDHGRETKGDGIGYITVHEGECDICKEKRLLSHIRNYNYLIK